MLILGLDPSSTCTGAALVRKDNGEPVLVDGYLLKPAAKLPYIERVQEMVQDVLNIVHEVEPDKVVIELPDGKRHGRMGKINMAALSIYGVAAGAIFGALIGRGVRVRAVGVNESTRNMPKKKRQQIVQATFRNYRPEKDKGMDLSDAAFIALCEHRNAVAACAAEPEK